MWDCLPVFGSVLSRALVGLTACTRGALDPALLLFEEFSEWRAVAPPRLRHHPGWGLNPNQTGTSYAFLFSPPLPQISQFPRVLSTEFSGGSGTGEPSPVREHACMSAHTPRVPCPPLRESRAPPCRPSGQKFQGSWIHRTPAKSGTPSPLLSFRREGALCPPWNHPETYQAVLGSQRTVPLPR